MKTFQFILWVVAIMAITTLSGCDFSKKKPETQPNIDSLVDAKVEERLSQQEKEKKEAEQNSTKKPEEETVVEERSGSDRVVVPIPHTEDDDDYDQELVGKIGPYSVSMYLEDLSSKDEGDFIGYYFYDERPNSYLHLRIASMVPINATGSMRLVLEEYTEKGLHSGTFKGQYECRGDYYSGTFTNSKGQKFEFILN